MKNTKSTGLLWVNSVHTFVLKVAPKTTARRLHITAQGCRSAATLGDVCKRNRDRNGVAIDGNGCATQRSGCAATLGFVVQPLRGWGAVIMILALWALALGQNASSITGRVIDEQGANVAGADVRLRSREGMQLSTATSARLESANASSSRPPELRSGSTKSRKPLRCLKIKSWKPSAHYHYSKH